MAKQFPEIDETQRKFIEEQHLFFVGTAAPDGRVNISPKGMDSLRVLDPNRIAWMNLTGSGNETAGHLLETDRMTLMWCSFTTRPLILRTYGTARTLHRGDAGWDELAELFPIIGVPGKSMTWMLIWFRPLVDMRCRSWTTARIAIRCRNGSMERRTSRSSPTGSRRTSRPLTENPPAPQAEP